jgi:dTDP-4-dehydrorhamnose reductase
MENFLNNKIFPLNILITSGNGNIAKLIVKNLKSKYNITSLSKNELNILNYNEIKNLLDKNDFDILIHTAIIGGRRIKI